MKTLLVILLLALSCLGYWVGLGLSSLVMSVLAIVNLENPVLLGFLVSLLFVTAAAWLFLLMLAYGRYSGKAYNSIWGICAVLVGTLVSIAHTEGFLVAVSFITVHILIIILSTTGFPGWNVSLLFCWMTIFEVITLPLFYLCRNVMFPLFLK